MKFKISISIQISIFLLILIFIPIASMMALHTYENQQLSMMESSNVQQGRLVAASLFCPEKISSDEAVALLKNMDGNFDARIRVLDKSGALIADSSTVENDFENENSQLSVREMNYDSAVNKNSEKSNSDASENFIYRLLSIPVRIYRSYFKRPYALKYDSAEFYINKNIYDGEEVLAALEGRYGSATRISYGGQRSVTLYSALPVYNSLKEANVESLVLFPLKSGYELLGYIWANNFDTEKTMHIKETLELTTFFLASEISSYQMFDKFRILSTVDMLTGVLNRNEMNNRVMQLGIDDRPGRKNIGIVFADLNGLKRMNDDNGHSAGDKLIKDAAAILKEVFTEGEIYRAGGDEFMILLRDTNMAQLEDYEKQIKERADKTDTVSFAVGLCIEEDSQKIYDAMKTADVNMYEDKKKFYNEHPDIKRH